MTDYKLVPVEPTQEMLNAPLQGGRFENRVDLRPSIYRAMLAAAPAVQGEPVGRVKTVGGYPDESEHTVEWLCKYKDLKDGDYLYTAPQQAEQQPSADDSLTPVPDEVFAAEFAAWWEQHGQFCRAGGGDYERTFAFEAWRHLYPKLMKLQKVAAEQQPAPDVAGLTEALRQYQHNDGSGLVFGYDKLLVDQYVAQLVEALEQGFPLLSDEGLDEVEHHCEWVIQRERKRVHSILASCRKQGGEA